MKIIWSGQRSFEKVIFEPKSKRQEGFSRVKIKVKRVPNRNRKKNCLKQFGTKWRLL